MSEEERKFEKKLIDYLYKMGFRNEHGDPDAVDLFNQMFQDIYGEKFEYFYEEITSIIDDIGEIKKNIPQFQKSRLEYEIKGKVKEIVQVCYEKISKNILARAKGKLEK